MARPRKDSELLNCKIDKAANEKLEEICKETGLTKTAVVEKALAKYYEEYKKTGRI